MKPQSPTRFVTNAFLPAEAFAGSVCQKEMRKYEHAPTPSQPRKVRSRLSPNTNMSIENTKRFRYRKNFGNFSSPFMYPIEYR